MDSLILSNKTSAFQPYGQAKIIKAAYLLSNHACASPYDNESIQYEWMLTNTKKTPVNKLRLIIATTNQEQIIAEAGSALAAFQRHAAAKVRSKDMIVKAKRLEKTIDQLFEDVAIGSARTFREAGLTDLLPLYEENTLLEVPMRDSGVFDVEYTHTTEQILKLEIDEEDPMDEIFFLPASFWGDKAENVVYHDVDDGEANDKKNSWFYPSFEITGYDKLTIAELQLLRAQTADKRAEFCKAMDEWILHAYTDSLAIDDVSFFKTKIEAKATALNEALRHHPVMKPYLVTPGEKTCVQIGAMHVHDIWRYYHQFGLIDETKLQELLEKDGDKKAFSGRWPTLSLRIPKKTQTIEEPVVTKRKSISLD